MKLITYAALAAGLAVAGAANAGVNLVQNGDFSTATDQSNHQIGGGEPNDVADWTSEGSNSYNLWINHSGDQTNATGVYQSSGKEYLTTFPSNSVTGQSGAFLALDACSTNTCSPGSVEQLVSGLTVGKEYRLTFDWATSQLASRSGATLNDALQYSLGGQTYTTTPVSTTPSQGATGWYQVTKVFTYDGKLDGFGDNLSFLAESATGGLPPMVLLDGVTLTAVPEPATWAMMLVGFGAIGYGLRRRRAAVVA
jgi:hypothetical protein